MLVCTRRRQRSFIQVKSTSTNITEEQIPSQYIGHYCLFLKFFPTEFEAHGLHM